VVSAASRSGGRSLRWRLSLTYAGVALLTAIVLGGILVAILDAYFSGVEEAHLQSAADRAARDLREADLQSTSLEQVARLTAYGLQARVQFLDGRHRVLADSGSPQNIRADTVTEGAAAGDAATGRTGDKPRSSKVVVRRAGSDSPGGVIDIRVSEVPAEGTTIMPEVVLAWALAAVVAVLAAAVAGYAISVRIARPVAALADASERMAGGDLSTRAEVRGGGEIGRLAASFNSMAGQVESTVTTLRRFVSDAAHQLGTPLTALRADLELAHDSAGAGDERRLIGRALEQEQRLEDLEGSLLALSRIESSASLEEPEIVDLAALIHRVADAFASRCEQADLTLTVSAPERGPLVSAGPERLRTAFENLVDNAVKFTPAGGSIMLEAGQADGQAVMAVTDTGPGVLPEDRDRVFERFYRSPAVADKRGTGLGLPIVRAIVGASGGTVRLADTSTGAQFEIRLPLAG
jgi:signal transduction histidine kinase